jgi:DNA-3-methyladenine glycosylase I
VLGTDRAGADFVGEQTQFSARITWTILVYHFRIIAMGAFVGKLIRRCSWADRTPLEIIYHDSEWGVPQRDDRALFEFLILEGAQAGLSWSTILAKREGYRAAFDGFDVQKVASYTDARLEKLMLNPAIVRNRLKIASARTNAKAFIKVQQEFGSFSNYYWAFVNDKPIINHFKTMADVPPKTELSDRISKDLLKRGFKFVGSTIIYAYMQATGMVNDHLTSCDCYKPLGGKKT